MSENPWMNQPEVDPFGGEVSDCEQFVEEALAAADEGSAGHWPTVAAHLAAEVRRLRKLADLRMERALDAAFGEREAERRGAERGWDEGYAEGTQDPPRSPNPYRKVAQQ